MIDNFFPLFFGGNVYGKITNKRLNTLLNSVEYFNTFVNLTNLCLDMFEWEGLPETCNYRYLEQALLFDGKCALAKHKDYGFITLRCNQENIYNIYGEYERLHLYSVKGDMGIYRNYIMGGDNSECDAVLCRDNDCSYPYYNYIVIGAERLANGMRSIDTATLLLKRPYYIVCDETQRSSIEKILSDIDANKPAIITNKSITPDSFNVLNTGANPDTLLQMWDNYYKHENNIRTLLGIQSNPNPDKSERLIVDEVNSNNQVTDMNINIRLKCRELFCEQVNEVFGLNVRCRLKNGLGEGAKDNAVQQIPDRPIYEG